jgi:hypothetical protein
LANERLTAPLKPEHFKIDPQGNVVINSAELAKAVKDRVLTKQNLADTAAIRVAVDTG